MRPLQGVFFFIALDSGGKSSHFPHSSQSNFSEKRTICVSLFFNRQSYYNFFKLCTNRLQIVKKKESSWFQMKKNSTFAAVFGEMAERSNAAVLKTVEGHTSGGSNPSLSAKRELTEYAQHAPYLFSRDKCGSSLTHEESRKHTGEQ